MLPSCSPRRAQPPQTTPKATPIDPVPSIPRAHQNGRPQREQRRSGGLVIIAPFTDKVIRGLVENAYGTHVESTGMRSPSTTRERQTLCLSTMSNSCTASTCGSPMPHHFAFAALRAAGTSSATTTTTS